MEWSVGSVGAEVYSEVARYLFQKRRVWVKRETVRDRSDLNTT